jgi:hypothetical protein
MTQSWRVRAVEYEVLPRNLVSATTGLSAYHVERRLGWIPDVALVKCVDDHGTRFTALGDSQSLGELVASSDSGDSREIALAANQWPVVIRGWLS